jgi:TetR/AcrR family transcriptional regulator, regulator of autoinduction and epiphytic fitness
VTATPHRCGVPAQHPRVQSRQAIRQAASELFAAQGFAATTISAIAAEADGAAETVYSRSSNKLRLISEILETAIVGNAPRVDVLELPEIEAVRAITDQRTRVRDFVTRLLADGVVRDLLD